MLSAQKLLAVGLFSLNSLSVQASLVTLDTVSLYDSADNITSPQDTGANLISGYFANSPIVRADKKSWMSTSNYHDKQVNNALVPNAFSRFSDPEYTDNLTRPIAVLTNLYNDRYPQNADSNAICLSSREFADSADDSIKCQQDLDFMAWMRWLGAELAANPVPAALLGVIIGFEASDDNSGEFPPKVIIPDDVANLPLPHAFWLFGGGIGGWLGLRRHANKARKPNDS
jgi:hypothetical protein